MVREAPTGAARVTMTQRSDLLVWLDMEMTGLDPETCVPLELAAIITTGELEELDQFTAVIWQPESALAGMSDFVRQMHSENRLLDAVRASTTLLEQADAGLAELIGKWCAPRAVLAGNSIHQDRLFVRRYFPTTEACLHYRMVDVSSLKELVRRWYGESALYPKAESSHTALEDIRASLAELRHYRATVMKPLPPGVG
jgi:oligoribonuclease